MRTETRTTSLTRQRFTLEFVPLALCTDCLAFAANGEWSDATGTVHDDAPNGWPGIGTGWECEAAADHVALCDHPAEDWTSCDADAAEWFSWSPCDACQRPTGGTRCHGTMIRSTYPDRARDIAEHQGATDGADSLAWFMGDLVSRDAAARILATVDEAIAAADGPTDSEIAEVVTYPEDGPEWETIADAYRHAFYGGLADAVQRECQGVLGIDPDTGDPYHADMIGGTYRYRGVAFRVTGGATGDRAVIGHYVGDDREFALDVSTLETLPADGYCAECGQVGCTGDGGTDS